MATAPLYGIPLKDLEPYGFDFFKESDAYRVCIGSDGQLLSQTDSDKDGSYKLIVATEDSDIQAVADLSYECFKQEIIVDYNDMTDFESSIAKLVVDGFVAYTDTAGMQDIYTGLQQRINDRKNASVKNALDQKQIDGSVVLAIVGKKSSDILATVELRLLPPDGKIPFSQVWLDELERSLVRLIPSYEHLVVENENVEAKPYLCNLCVDKEARSRGIGKALLRCVEFIATKSWEHDCLYLHVNPKNEAAYRLYEQEGFINSGKRWNPIWAGDSTNITHMIKKY